MDVSQAAAALKREWTRWYETVELPDACIYCRDEEARIVWNGSRGRPASVLLEGIVVFIAQMLCRRVRRQSCRRSQTLRPPGMVARRHYQPEVVSQALSRLAFDAGATKEAVASELGCDRRTMARWVGWTAGVFAPEEPQARVLEAVGPVLTVLRPVAGLARKALRSARCWLLERAARVLRLVVALATAWGLEPPGPSCAENASRCATTWPTAAPCSSFSTARALGAPIDILDAPLLSRVYGVGIETIPTPDGLPVVRARL